ncbi:unnamed protein product [Phytomonas sp. Hart1]|nr:unnamed protein product [Phytomonas sp. Hart1]|eukprot:CCW67199.1 unnamed protein product [Phytomonas sp. isolate Hart1]
MLHNDLFRLNDPHPKILGDESPHTFPSRRDDLSGGAVPVNVNASSVYCVPSVFGEMLGTTEPKETDHPSAILQGRVIGEDGKACPPPHAAFVEEPQESSIPNILAQVLPITIDKPSLETCAKQGNSDTFSFSIGGNCTCKTVDTQAVELLLDIGRYVGEVDPKTQRPQGKGILNFNEGGTHNGEWQNGMANGYGQRSYVNGDVYRGQWVNGIRNGPGECIYAEGHRFKGNYVNDEPNGHGVFVAMNNDRYSGMWCKGQKDGKGQEILHDGQKFVGRWKNDKKQGRGRLYLPGVTFPIYGVWNQDEFFRELTSAEVIDKFEADSSYDFGGLEMNNNSSFNKNTASDSDFRQGERHGGVAEPEGSSELGKFGFKVAERIMGGLSFIEDRLEALGRAFENVAEPSLHNTEASRTCFSVCKHFDETTTREDCESSVFFMESTDNVSTLRTERSGVAQSSDSFEPTEVVNIEDYTRDANEEESDSTNDALYTMSLQDKVPLSTVLN